MTISDVSSIKIFFIMLSCFVKYPAPKYVLIEKQNIFYKLI